MKRLVILTIAAAALVIPSTAFASGVVLKVDKQAHLVAVAQTKTKVALVHTSAASKLHVGQRVAMQAHALRNGTYSAAGVRVVGHARTVHFRALLLKRSASRLVVSAGGAVIALHRGRVTASANDSGPAPGTTVQVTATVGQNDDLDEDQVTTVSADHPGGAIEGTLTLGTGTITVVSEHMALVLNVPSGFDLSQFQTGDEVLAVFAQQTDGTLLLSSLSGDQSAQQADQGQQGEDGQGHDGHGGDGHGDGGGGDDGGGDDGGSVGGNGGNNPAPTVGING